MVMKRAPRPTAELCGLRLQVDCLEKCAPSYCRLARLYAPVIPCGDYAVGQYVHFVISVNRRLTEFSLQPGTPVATTGLVARHG